MFAFIKHALAGLDDRLRIDIEQLPPEGIARLPTRLGPFIWFFARQIKGLLAFMMAMELVVAMSSSVIFWYVGRLVEQQHYTEALMLGGLALVILRQQMIGTLHGIYHLLYTPFVGNMIRRQLYWYTAQQSLSFFNNDFAGRIANKLIQSAPSLREVLRSGIGAVWFASIFTVSNLYFMARISTWLALPLVVWLMLYASALRYFVPKVQQRSTANSHVMSHLTGQVVDSFTNFLPIKYFARTLHEDRRMVDILRDHSRTFRATTSTIWLMGLTIDLLNTSLLIATALVGFWLIGARGQAGIGAMAMALPMAMQATFQSGWIMFEISGIFENLGRVQEGIEALTKPHAIVDAPNARPLKIAGSTAAVAFKHVSFGYGRDILALHDFDLAVPAGQKVGLVGKSGAGKSTVANLIVRAYEVEDGAILIDGQNIAQVTQDSLRHNITVVTQESYLFHRSIGDNIRYGKLDAAMADVIAAAKKAHAHDFIMALEDNLGRRGYDAHVGERGVKLSGGQRQRIGLARAIIKDAPILILDEATSALDSESEHAIQAALEGIMAHKTVIAIAHRLSTLRQMDRIIVMEAGHIIEDGTHEDLICKPGGTYAMLWGMQSGGFLNETRPSLASFEVSY
jgi:ATP-binding cassette, subfamily B, multidrug efflux pump